ncbi:MAG: PQQ-dependent sugar dehydrogenase [Nitrososphaerales archaeon]
MKKLVMFILVSMFYVPILPSFGEPLLIDEDYMIRKFVSDLVMPTTIAFVSNNDILVLQKNDGKVMLVRDGILQKEPVLDLKVSNNSERGLLGIVAIGSTVYLYLTESDRDGGTPLGNRIYKFHWNSNSLIEQVLIKDLPVTPGPNHDGGAMVTGLNGEVFAVIGDLNRKGPLQNFASGSVDDTGVIVQLMPQEKYYAMGIRNSFGLAVDPVTGNLWDTENGPDRWDEINLVPDGFNSGWRVIMGPATESDLEKLPEFQHFVYSNPEFSWERVVAPTALSFINSEPFKKYQNSLFVGDCNNGILYNFSLNEERNGFVFNNPILRDSVANEGDSIEELVFGLGFGCITDIDVGPDGYLYLTSLEHGTIYQIQPKSLTSKPFTFTLSSSYDGTTYTLSGKTDGAIPSSFTIIPKQSVRFDIKGNGGDLELTLPKKMLSGIHTVRTNSQEIPFEEISSNISSTTIRFAVPGDTDSIEIIADFVVPEFGIIALFVFAGAMTTIIIISRRNQIFITLLKAN